MSHTLRPVDTGDLELICRHRHEMFKASGREEALLAPMTAAFRPWLEPRLKAGDYFGWIAEIDGTPAGGLGMMVLDWPPHPSHPSEAARGYILNVYVEPEHRGKGIAGALMRQAMAEAKARGLQYMILHATKMARPMYERLGWGQTAELAVTLEP
jgi:GNAT superfamily N-acetyltransferase